MELTWAIIWSCLMRVPVRHWRTLFHYLRRLDDTFHEAQADGRGWVNWHLREDGVIWVSAWELTEAEQHQRGALPEGFDPAPWTRAALQLEPAHNALTIWTSLTPPLHPGHTARAPQIHPAKTTARAPPVHRNPLIPAKAGISCSKFWHPHSETRSLRALVLGKGSSGTEFPSPDCGRGCGGRSIALRCAGARGEGAQQLYRALRSQ